MKRRGGGFTLLEVMAAIVILALAFAVLLKAMGASVALTHQAAARTRAAAWAQSMLDSVDAMQPPQPGTTQGRFDATYHWRLQVTPWRPADSRKRKSTSRNGPLRLYELDLAVMWGPQARQHVAHFRTLRVARVNSNGEGMP